METRYEYVVQAHVRAPRGERVSRLGGVQGAERVDVPGVEDLLERAPTHLAATEPDECAQPVRERADVEQLAGSERIEVAGEHVKAVLVLPDAGQERAQLADAAPLGPRRVHGTEVHAEDPAPCVSRR